MRGRQMFSASEMIRSREEDTHDTLPYTRHLLLWAVNVLCACHAGYNLGQN